MNKYVLSSFAIWVLAPWAAAATINVTPGNISFGNPGDTISFAPGTYTLTTRANGAAATFPAGRAYVGNGATIALSSGLGDKAATEELIQFAGSSAVTEITGFTFTDAQVHCEGGVFNVHNNAFANGRRGIFVASQSNSKFSNNTFSQLTDEGIYGYPGNGNTYDSNTFDNVWEPIHLIAACDTTDISNNVITHATRIGIELQDGMTNLNVNNNFMGEWLTHVDSTGIDSHMGISCATGGSGSAPYAGQGNNITISGNTISQDGPGQAVDDWAKSAIEIMGTSVVISNNLIWGWGQAILNGSTGSGVASSNNKIYGGGFSSNDGVSWPITPIASTNDVLMSLQAISIPTLPGTTTSTTSTGGSATGTSTGSITSTTTTTTTTSTVAAPISVAVAAGSTAGQISVTVDAPPAGESLTILVYPTSLGAGSATNLGSPTGDGPYVIGSINNTWKVTVGAQYVSNGVSSGITYSPYLQVFGGPAATAPFAPVLEAPVTSVATTKTPPASPTPTPPVALTPTSPVAAPTTPPVTAPTTQPVLSTTFPDTDHHWHHWRDDD